MEKVGDVELRVIGSGAFRLLGFKVDDNDVCPESRSRSKRRNVKV